MIGLRKSVVSKTAHNKVLDSDTEVVFSQVDDLELFEKQIETEFPKSAVDYYIEFSNTNARVKKKAWFDKQEYLFLGILLSACVAMGINSTPMEGIEPDNYYKISNNNLLQLLLVTEAKRILTNLVKTRSPEWF